MLRKRILAVLGRTRLDAEKLRRGLAEDRGALGVGELRRAEDVVDGSLGPAEGIVGAHDELRGADLRGEVAQRLGREDERVEIELPEIFGRLLLERHGGAALPE